MIWYRVLRMVHGFIPMGGIVDTLGGGGRLPGGWTGYSPHPAARAAPRRSKIVAPGLVLAAALKRD